MTVIQNTARRVGLAWTPMYTTIAIVAAALLIGLLPGVKMNLVVNGIFLGAIIALGAIGLTLVYGILNFANIAHGDYMTMGAYVALFIVGSLLPQVGIEGKGLGPFTFGYPMLIALPIAVAAVAALAVVLDIAIYRRLRERGVNNVVLAMASLGLAIALRGLVTDHLERRRTTLSPGDQEVLSTGHGCARTPGCHLHHDSDRDPGGSRIPGADPHQDREGHAGHRGQPEPGPRKRHRYAARYMVNLDHRRSAGGDRRDTPGGLSGAVATRYGVESS